MSEVEPLAQMPPPLPCPKCNADMEQGFNLDATHGGQLVSRWAAGAPRKSFWMGLKSPPENRIIPVGVFRCTSCGYLESYARPEFAAS